MHSDPRREKFWDFDYKNTFTTGGAGFHENIQNPEIRKELTEDLTPLAQHLILNYH